MADKLSKVTELKVKLYDLIEQQAIYQAEFTKLEERKADLAKQLGEARKAEAEANE